jgi:DNA-binding SARP family transcriptional activator
MDDLQVRLFGELSMRQGGQSVPCTHGKAFELFCYLLIYRNRAHTRETLSEVLWPGKQPAASKRYLRQALWRLNTIVQRRPRHTRTEHEPILIIDPIWVRINLNAALWLDISAFEATHSAVRDISGHSLSDQQAKHLEDALMLYRGDLLETWYHDWCSYERSCLQLARLAMLDQLIGYCDARQLYAKGLSFGQTVLRCDPAREYTHVQLMRLHYRTGNRTAAIRQYERCAAAMAQDLGIQPSVGTVSLYEQIRADQVPDITVPLDIPIHPNARKPEVQRPMPEQRHTTTLLNLHRRLDQIQASLVELQESVQQNNGWHFAHAQTSRNGVPENITGVSE